MTQLNLKLPSTIGELEINLAKGCTLFLLGANGSGKSGLISHLCSQSEVPVLKISAHRPSMIASNAIQVAQSDIYVQKSSIQSVDRQTYSRYRDDHQYYRVPIVLNNLIEAENKNAREYKNAGQGGNAVAEINRLLQIPSPLENVNEIFKRSNIPIVVSINDDQKFLASKNGSEPYSIAQLSDGERSAMILIADVLTAKPGTLIIIDEPERNLHRSIISPLVTTLVSLRSDCYFIIATHDLNLVMDNYESSTLIVRGCEWEKETIQKWDASLLDSNTNIDPDTKRAILGSEGIILFVEGDESSLDHSIYKTMFPNVKVIPKGGCGNVIQSVKAINTNDTIRWITAYGLIDKDDRTDTTIRDLKSHKIYALPSHSIESLYYCKEVVEFVCNKLSSTTGLNTAAAFAEIKADILNISTSECSRLSARVCERKLRDKVTYPTFREILEGSEFSFSINIAEAKSREEASLRSMIASESINEIIGRYPMRETTLFLKIARSLGLTTRFSYENTVRNLIAKEDSLKLIIKSKLGELVTVLVHEPDVEEGSTVTTI